MRCLKRNQRSFKWAAYLGDVETVDANDDYNGHSSTYSAPVTMLGNVSAARGEVSNAAFGTDLTYDKAIALDALPAGMDEHSVLWVDDLESEAPDYIVRRIAKSLNGVMVAISKVDVQ